MILQLHGKVAREHELKAQVDDDFPVNGRRYYAMRARTKKEKWYAWRRDGDRKTLYLHRDAFEHATGAAPSGEVDHISGDSLDCRSHNLREASRNLQSHNVQHGKGYSNMRGVCKKTILRYVYWIAYIYKNNKLYKTKCFPFTKAGKLAAARQYDKWAIELYGDAARTNFPRGDYESDM